MKITITGNPIANKRVRCGCLNGHGHAYNDPQQTIDMKAVRTHILDAWNAHFDSNKAQCESVLSAESFHVGFDFYIPIAKSESTTIRNLKLWGLIPCTDKPDWDNLGKLYSDCMTGIIFSDDKLITLGAVGKVKFSDNPRTEITIIPKQKYKMTTQVEAIYKLFSPNELKQFFEQTLKFSKHYDRYQTNLEEDSPYRSVDLLSATAMHMIDFANAYADKLKKIAKLNEST